MNHHFELGPLEKAVMDILWERGDSSVHQVCGEIDRPLAYTTVMTTLDRLYKKGLLSRRKIDRAFLYAPQISRNTWEREVAAHLIQSYIQRPEPAGELLISCLVEAVGQHDQGLLDELEKKIRLKREELDHKARL